MEAKKKNMYENNQPTADGLNVKFIRGVFYHSYGLRGLPGISSVRLFSDFFSTYNKKGRYGVLMKTAVLCHSVTESKRLTPFVFANEETAEALEASVITESRCSDSQTKRDSGVRSPPMSVTKLWTPVNVSLSSSCSLMNCKLYSL